jgi:hypothetical protein
MAIFTNAFTKPAGVVDGDALTPLSTGNTVAGGDFFTHVIQGTPADVLFYSGGMRRTLGTTSSYVRWDKTETGQTRGVMRRPFTMPAAPTASTIIMQMRDGADALMASFYVMTTRATRISAGTSIVVASDSNSVSGFTMAVGTRYWIEMAVTVGSAATSADGRIEYHVTDDSNTELFAYDSGTTLVTGNVNPNHYRFGNFAAMTGWTYDVFDGPVRAGGQASGWIGPVGSTGLAGTVTLAPTTGAIPATTTATAAFTGGTGTAKSYTFSWGDGTANTGPQSSASATHTYTTKGTYTATVNVVNT